MRPGLCALACLLPSAGFAVDGPAAFATLILDKTSVAPGGTLAVGVRLTAAPPWHWYWRNSGDSGLPPQLDWLLPPGWTARSWRWPAPSLLTSGNGIALVRNDGILLADVRVPATAAASTLRIGVRIAWMACHEACLPLDHTVMAAVTVGDDRTDAQATAQLDRARADLPAPTPASLHRHGAAWRLVVPGFSNADAVFLPDSGGWHEAPTAIPGNGGSLTLVPRAGIDRPARLGGVVLGASRAAAIDLAWPSHP